MLSACGESAGPDVPETYAFESRFGPGSSVAYSGQISRHVLIEDLASFIEGMTDAIDSGELNPAAEGDVVARLEYYFSVPAADRSEDPFAFTTTPMASQSTYGDLSGTAILLEKLAGNDAVTDHRDWSTEFAGWSDEGIAEHGGGIDTPTNLVRAFFETIEANALDRANGVPRTSPFGEELPVHVTASGIDFGELVPKFLFGALAFSQATDDYLDDEADDADKGLLSDNTMPDGTSPYTVLEHAWDEGYGYFGASRDYDGDPETYMRTRDANGDGSIDLTSEHTFSIANYAISRDGESAESARTHFARDISLAFRTGRAIITAADGELTPEELDALREQRDIIVTSWEAAFAATLVHYLNEVLVALGAPLDHQTFLNLAHVWSEMRGFALSFQFNPRSSLSQAQFLELNALLRDSPVFEGASEIAAYRADLLEARALVGEAFGFDAANLGDEQGMNGW